MRPFVQEPRNTVSTVTSRIGVPGVKAMYSNALWAAVRSCSVSKISGWVPRQPADTLSGIRAPGDEGSQMARVEIDSESKTASGSDRNSANGRRRRPVGSVRGVRTARTYAKVVSSER